MIYKIKISAEEKVVIPIGRVGENEVTEVRFDISGWQDAYGAGQAELVVRRATDTNPYPVVLSADGNEVVWKITDTDLATPGKGWAQLTYIKGDKVKKSVIYSLRIASSLEGTAEPPDPYEDWVATLQALSAATETNAVNAATSASNAKDSEDAAKASETVAKASEIAAKESERKAKASEDSAAADAERAEQSAAVAGYIAFEINRAGHLIYSRTSTVEVDFRLSDGHLILEGV